MHQKPFRDPFLILVNSQKQPFHARNCFKNEILVNFFFFFRTQTFLMNKIIKTKRGLKLVTSHSSGHKKSLDKFLD